MEKQKDKHGITILPDVSRLDQYGEGAGCGTHLTFGDADTRREGVGLHFGAGHPDKEDGCKDGKYALIHRSLHL